jgi:hypothetical protein
MPALSLKRAKVTRTEFARHRHWRTPDGLAELVEIHWTDTAAREAYSDYWIIIVHAPALIIERRRTRKAAEKALAARINPTTRKGKR